MSQTSVYQPGVCSIRQNDQRKATLITLLAFGIAAVVAVVAYFIPIG